MEILRTWALTLLFTAAGCFVFYFILPSGGLSKTAKSVISAVSLAAVMLPFFGIAGKLSDVSFDFSFTEPETDAVPEYYLTAAEEAVSSVVREIILEYTSVPCEISVSVHAGEGQEVIADRIVLIFSALPENADSIRDEIAAETMIIPEIKTESADER